LNIPIPHGREMQTLDVPERLVAGIAMPKTMSPALDPETLVRKKIETSVEQCGLAARARSDMKTCIVVTDRTRSTPLKLIVPLLLNQLHAWGIDDERITVISGGGMHAADGRQDLVQTLGPAVLERVETFVNEPDNDELMVTLGRSDIGTPVEVHQRFAEADIKLGVINVNPCMLAGWSGGGKIVQPAISSRRSIYENHKHFVKTLMDLRCASLMGVMPPHNVVRADLEQCAAISGVDLVVNTVLDSQRQLVDVYCGDQVTAHRAAVSRMAPFVEVSLPQAADVLVAAVGEPALEVSLFQGGSRVCGGADRYLRPGGTLVMVNACTEGIYEGFEHEEYREWMRQMPTPLKIGQLVESGEMGGEKGCVLFTFSWLLHEMKCRIIIVSDGMTATELKEIHLDHAASVQQAVDDALSNYSGNAAIGIMPYAGLVLPTLLSAGE
jgi:nickel-dependent lactate racemase